MTVDLHTHSTASDGSDPPEHLVELAAEAGLSALALTDHDTQEGLDAAVAAAATHHLELIPGVELSLSYDSGTMHLIVLWLDPGTGPLQNRLHGLQSGRTQRNEEIVHRLEEAGLPIRGSPRRGRGRERRKAPYRSGDGETRVRARHPDCIRPLAGQGETRICGS